jgi:hypothetical protein
MHQPKLVPNVFLNSGRFFAAKLHVAVEGVGAESTAAEVAHLIFVLSSEQTMNIKITSERKASCRRHRMKPKKNRVWRESDQWPRSRPCQQPNKSLHL